ncbi:MAG: hypothetical protein M1549_02060 [Candidatus Dependentiae bacterium]|nr:hypothetical protein [Candidatus Dependentiae bacterium]
MAGYGSKGIYSLEEYYVRNLGAYYAALDIGPSHNYYLGRAEADITPWVEYFVEGMATACDRVSQRLLAEVEAHPHVRDHATLLRQLDPCQRRVLELFRDVAVVTSRQIAQLFAVQPRTGAQICKDWVAAGFLVVVDPSNRKRSYRLAEQFEELVSE